MVKSVIDDVSDTALWVAVYRERETQRTDALFRDPLAARLVGDRGKMIESQMSGSRYTSWSVVIRTCIIDAYISEMIQKGVDCVINLGCGLDTRPYRLELPAQLRWVEVDFPKIIHHKEKLLADEKTRCHLERIAIDLNDEVAARTLFARLNSQTKNCLIITEGVIPYLSEAQVAQLARNLHSNNHFNYWIVEYFAPQIMKYMNSRKRKVQMQNAPFVFNPKHWLSFFTELGWQKLEMRYVGEESEKLNRPIPLPWWAQVLQLIFRPKNAAAYKRFSGYAILENQRGSEMSAKSSPQT